MTETISNTWVKSIVRGGTISLFGNVALITLSLIFQWYQARMLGATGVGIYTIGFSVVGIALLFAMLGLDRGLIKFIAHYISLKDKARASGVIWTAVPTFLVMSVIVSGLLLAGSNLIGNRIYHAAQLVPILRLMTLSLPFMGITILIDQIPMAFRRVEYQAIIEQILVPLLRLLCAGVFVILYSRSVISFAYANLIATVLGALIVVWAVLRFKPFRQIVSVKPFFEHRTLLSFSGPLFLTQLFIVSEGQLGLLILGGLASFSEVGIYRICSRLVLPMTIWLTAINTIFSPMIASLYAEKKLGELERIFKTTTKWILSFSLPFFLLLVGLNKDFLRLFGEEFTAGAPVLVLICIAQLINIGTGSVGMVLQMTGQVWVTFAISALTLLLTIVLDVILVPRYGALGAALSDIGTIVSVNLIRLWFVFRTTHIHPFSRNYLKPVLAAGITFLVLVFLKAQILGINEYSRMFLITVILIGVYLIMMLLFRLDEADKMVIHLIRDKLMGRDRLPSDQEVKLG